MSIKLNSYILSDELIDKMKDRLNETRKNGLELGFNICKTNDTLISKDDCIGTTCQISIQKECSEQEKTPKVGDYHTHPHGPAFMSPTDTWKACGLDFRCVGSVNSGKINCFVRKKNTSTEDCRNGITGEFRGAIQFYRALSYTHETYFDKINI